MKMMKILKRMAMAIVTFLLFVYGDQPIFAATKPVADGEYAVRTRLDNKYVLDVAGPSLDNGATLQLWSDVNVENQKFIIEYDDNGYYTIKSTYSGKVLDTDGNDVYQYSSNGSDSQKWKFEDAGSGYYFIINKDTGLYLDVDNAYAADATNVKMFVRNGGYKAQEWKFDPKGVIIVDDDDEENAEEVGIPDYVKTESERKEELKEEINEQEEIKEVKEYTLTSWSYWPGNGISSVTSTKRNDTELVLHKEMPFTGYKYEGIYKMRDGESFDDAMARKEVITSIPAGNTENINVCSGYTLITYNVNYELNGGSNNPENPSSYNKQSYDSVLKAPTRAGYIFKGWYKDAAFNTQITKIEASKCVDVTVYAKWEKEPEPVKPAPAPVQQPAQKIMGDINIVKKAYPEGTPWGKNAEYQGTYECFAFARKGFYLMYGCDMSSAYSAGAKYNYGKLKNIVLAYRLAETKNTVSNAEVKNCLINALQGDILQVARYKTSSSKTTTPHTMIVDTVDQNGIRVYHGNWGGKVCSTYFTWDSFRTNFLNNPNNNIGVGVSVYRYSK